GEERIIVVDDDAILVKINMCRLKEVGYQVSGFIDSREALEAIREKPADFDLLVTDQTMPKLTGEELIAAVHEIRPDMPVILCTGHHNRETEADSIHKYVHKPLHQDELLLAVREVLDKHLKNR
ncbi:MAG: response regulator, partial [Thermodesulfobacteriota bacterium]